MSDSRRAAREEREPAVTDVLPRLKRRGCNLLVTGAVSEATASRAARRLFGSPDLERTRIVVRTAEVPAVDELLPTGVTADDPSVRVLAYDSYRSERRPLDALADAVATAVDGVVSSTPLVGGELRLSLPSLGPVVADHETAVVERFLRRLTATVVGARGMGHYRYPGPRADVPRTLDGLFDGFVDLRDGPRPEQRLSIPTVGPTDWTAL